MSVPHVEYRILMTGEEKRQYSENFNAIEGMEERKQEVLARLRKVKGGRSGASSEGACDR